MSTHHKLESLLESIYEIKIRVWMFALCLFLLVSILLFVWLPVYANNQQQGAPTDVQVVNDLQGSIAAGWAHTCLITTAGGVKCWGNNASGQLGDGTEVDRSTPVDVTGMSSGVKAIVTGAVRTCALTTGDGIKCWGDNADGLLGDGTTLQQNRPVNVVGLGSGVSAIALGWQHSCVLTNIGGVQCWGGNDAGQLGNGTTITQAVPGDVTGLRSGVTAIASTYNHACALTSAGGVKCWGGNFYGQLGDGTTITRSTPVDVVGLSSGVRMIATGVGHSCALLTNGSAKCWGYNIVGQLGNGVRGDQLTPVDVSGISNGRAIVAGGYFTCLLNSSSLLFCWGDNTFGQLGDGTRNHRRIPTSVVGVGSSASAVAVGRHHTCARNSSNDVKCWGWSDFGQLGNGVATIRSNLPVDPVGSSSNVMQVAPGGLLNCALMSSHEVKCSGDLGRTFAANVPLYITGLPGGYSAISTGRKHLCALNTYGKVQCWGNNDAGQLGDGTNTSSLSNAVAADVVGLNSGITALSVGDSHTCALTIDGGVKCWGDNSAGQLGDGTATQRNSPVAVAGLSSEVGAIAAGYRHTCALMNTGGVQCWGSIVGSNTPVEIAALLSGVSAVTAGQEYSCVLINGSVKCWGANAFGQLGDGTTSDHSTPVDVVGLSSGVTAITAKGLHTCALRNNGGIQCWGKNSFGQLGDGSFISRTQPVDVVGLTSGMIAVAVGADHTCAITSNNGMKCWGENQNKQLGDGNGSVLPVDVLNLSATTPTPSPTPRLTVTATPGQSATPELTTTPTPTLAPTLAPAATATSTLATGEAITAQLSPDNEAMVALPNNLLSLQFPAGAVSSHTILTATQQRVVQQPTNPFAFANKAFTVIASNTSGTSVSTFSRPYTLTVRYSDADWQTAGIASESDLNLYFWNGSTWMAILPCAGCIHDRSANRMVAVLDHLTEFALLGQQSGQTIYLPMVRR